MKWISFLVLILASANSFAIPFNQCLGVATALSESGQPQTKTTSLQAAEGAFKISVKVDRIDECTPAGKKVFEGQPQVGKEYEIVLNPLKGMKVFKGEKFSFRVTWTCTGKKCQPLKWDQVIR